MAALAAFCDARSGPDFVEARIDAADRMLTLAQGRALLELLARRIRLRARLEVGDLVGVDADIVGYARIADRLRSPTYGWLVPLWLGMRKALDGDLDAASGYADEVATQAEAAQSTNAVMMAWTLRWRVARLRQDAGTMAELPARMAPWAENYPAWSCTFALLYAELGDSELGRRHLRRVMEAGLDSIPFDSEWVELLWSLGEAALLLDERETAAHRPRSPGAVRGPLGGRRLRRRLLRPGRRPTGPSRGLPGPPDHRAARPGSLRPDGHGVAAGVPRPDRDRGRLQGHA